MSTLLAVSLLGVLCLVAELFNLKKWIIPVSCAALLGILVLNFKDFNHSQSFFHNMILVDNFSVLFSGLFVLLTLFLVAMAAPFYEAQSDKISDFIAIKIFLLSGAVAMVTFGNLAMFFLGLEVLSIALYVLAGSDRLNIKSNEAGMKYFIMGSFASAVILFGIALIYGAVGSFDIIQIYEASNSATTADWFYIGVCMITVGMLFKLATVPFHFWAPDVYEGAPTLTTATMSTLSKVVAIATFYKLSLAFTGNMKYAYQIVLIIAAIASMSVGNIMALQQQNVKRLLAFSGISHAGFMLLALLDTENNLNTLLFYTVSYALSGIAAFAVVVLVDLQQNSTEMNSFRGFGKRHPLLALVLSLSLLSMAGIPFFSGFFAKFFMLQSMLQKGFLVVVLAGVINSIISVYYYVKLIINLYQPAEAYTPKSNVSTSLLTIVGVIAVLISIIIGLFPNMIMSL